MTSTTTHAGAPKSLVLLGSTGSIGTQALEVVRRLGQRAPRVSALAAGGDVGAAQVSNDIDAGGFGQARGVKQLQGVALGGRVAYGLAMGAQRTHLPG